MTAALWIVLLVALQRLAELALSARNARRLKAEGGVEWGRGHYPLMVGLHAAWLAGLAAAAAAPTATVSWPLIGAFLLLQGARVWTIRSLGRHWTTRIVRVPGSPRVRRGPYRCLRHPNYLIVVLEIALLPAAFGMWWFAGAFSLANGALLAYRIRVEEAALAS